MNVQILEEATADLADGYRFYKRQAEGLGERKTKNETDFMRILCE